MQHQNLSLNPENEYCFRLLEQQTLTAWLQAGHSCALIGVSNAGKSRLLKALATPANCSAIQPDGKLVMALIDCQMAAEDEAAFYELALRQVISAVQEQKIASSTLNVLQSAHSEMLRNASLVAFRALFSQSLHTLLSESDLSLIILLDELDDALAALPPWAFRMLRALRDELPGRLLYVAAVSRRMERIRPDALLYEFREMFLTHTLVLRPLPANESAWAFDRLALGQGAQKAPLYRQVVLDLAGGHPGLIKRCLLTAMQMEHDPTDNPQAWARLLLDSWAVQQECQRLWDELEIEEQEALLAFTGGGANSLEPRQRQALEDRGLLIFDAENHLALFSPLFTSFLRRRLSHLRKAGDQGVHCDFETGKIWVDGKDLTLHLSDAQRRLVRYLYQRAGSVCRHQEVMDAVWGVSQGVTPSSMYELVKRLRQKIGDDPDNPRYILSVKGEGYMLKLPD